MNTDLLLSHLRNIPDFPKPGIQFKDVSTLFIEPSCLIEILDELVRLYKDKGITKVVGIESRGFVMGAILAQRLGVGFVMCRKIGKLPGETRIRGRCHRNPYGCDFTRRRGVDSR